MRLPAIEFSEGLPEIEDRPSIPNVGEVGGDPTTYINSQFGNLPNLSSITQISAIEKLLTEQIYALLKGQLPDATRPEVYETRRAQLALQLTQIITTRGQLKASMTSALSSSMAYATQKIGELTAELNGIPAEGRTKIEELRARRRQESIDEIEEKNGRAQAVLDWLESL